MTSNLMEQYIKTTTTFLKNFTKMFLAEKYNEEISNEYIAAYIDSRIYNYGETEQKFFYKRIYASLLEKKNEIQKLYPKIDENVLENHLKLYEFVFYIDDVRPISDLTEFVKQICDKRRTLFEIEGIKNIENRILKIIKKYREEKEDFIKKYQTEDFSIQIDKYTLIKNTYKVTINYNFKIPYIYSNTVINEVYNDGTVNEDKLIIEYILLTLECIKDINNADFSTKYLVDFANTLYKKQKKLKQTLRVINNAAIQDKIILKIYYQDFEENKELIYSLIKEGYRFAIIIDDSFKPTLLNIKKLSIFEFLLVPEQCKNYEKIKENENKIINTIIYDL